MQGRDFMVWCSSRVIKVLQANHSKLRVHVIRGCGSEDSAICYILLRFVEDVMFSHNGASGPV